MKKKSERECLSKIGKQQVGKRRVSNIGFLYKIGNGLVTFCQQCLFIGVPSSIQFLYHTMLPKLASYCFDRKFWDFSVHQTVENDQQTYKNY